MSLSIDTFFKAVDGFKKTEKVYIGYNEVSLGSTIFENMKKYRNRIVQYIVDTDDTDTYGELLIRSIRTALKLKEKGITRNDIVSTCTHNHKNSCVPFIAAQFLGSLTANFDPNLSHLDTIHLLKLIKPRIIFVSKESLPFMEKCLSESKLDIELVVLGNSEKYSQFQEYLEPSILDEKFKPLPIADSRETAVILFSSGTTGFPKGVCLSHYTLIAQSCNSDFFILEKENNEEEQPVMLLYTSLYWISAVIGLLKCIGNGQAKVVCSKFDAAETWKLIEKYKVMFAFLAPYHAVEFLHQRPTYVDTSSLKVFMTGSCPVTKNLMKDLRTALPNTIILQAYGQTEAGRMITGFNTTIPEEVEMQNKKPQSCGKICTEVVWKIVDPLTETILGPNQKGELRIKSNYVMNGYYNMDSSSAFDSEGYLKTGDIVYVDEDECFFVVDRLKEMFKYRGWHILPAILEEVLMSHPAIKEAVVVGIPHEIDGDYPMGIVVLYPEYEDVTPRDIEIYVEERVSENQKLRAGVKIVKEILRTSTGKVIRNAMKRMVLKGEI